MKIIKFFFPAILSWVLFAHMCSAQSIVGMHQLQISEPNVRTRLVSIPFLRLPLALGRLDGVQSASSSESLPTLSDVEAAFAQILDEDGTYILRITEGDAVGDWFLLDAVSESGELVSVREDGLAGSVDSLTGNESFAIHRLFSLSELFPVTHAGFTSAPIDLLAMQVHFYDGSRFSKCWLSDGTLTDHVGWTVAEDGALNDAGSLAILPGTSFLVVYPNALTKESIRINGVVPEFGLTVPVYPGYNYVSVKYTESIDGSLEKPLDYLDSLGLVESGFQGGADADSSDLILALNDQDGTFLEGYYYDTLDRGFKQVGTEASEITLNEVGPGRGFVILNRGEPYLWKFNHTGVEL
jgi:hypothetical protein